MSQMQKYRVVAGLAVALGACASAAPQEEDVSFIQSAPADQVTVSVQNDYWRETDIYAVMGSTRTRIGSVMPGMTAKLQIPRQLGARQEIRFQADPVGPDEPYTFPAIPVPLDLTIQLTVAPALSMSSYAIR